MLALIIILAALGALAYLELRREQADLRMQQSQQLTWILSVRRELNSHKEKTHAQYTGALRDIVRVEEDAFAIRAELNKRLAKKKARK